MIIPFPTRRLLFAWKEEPLPFLAICQPIVAPEWPREHPASPQLSGLWASLWEDDLAHYFPIRKNKSYPGVLVAWQGTSGTWAGAYGQMEYQDGGLSRSAWARSSDGGWGKHPAPGGCLLFSLLYPEYPASGTLRNYLWNEWVEEKHRGRAPGSAAHSTSRFTNWGGAAFTTSRCMEMSTENQRAYAENRCEKERKAWLQSAVDLNTSRTPNVSTCYCCNKLHPPTLCQHDGCVASNWDNKREYSQHTGRTKTNGTLWRPVSGAPQTRGSHGGTAKELSRKGPLRLTETRGNAKGAVVTVIGSACSATSYANTHTLQPYKFIRWFLKTKYETSTNVRLGPNGPHGPWGAALAGEQGGVSVGWRAALFLASLSHLFGLSLARVPNPSSLIETPVSCPSYYRRRTSSQSKKLVPPLLSHFRTTATASVQRVVVSSALA